MALGSFVLALSQADTVRAAAISPATTAHCFFCIAVLPSPDFLY
jgi:hypothetical protein